jgi:mRNA-degrading endonuclease RelE of RelBE toxin-antitoxin system
MSIKVVETVKFAKDLKNLKKRYRAIESDLEPVVTQLEAGETPGDRITGNKYPVYKVRVKNSDIRKGQSSGYRVIYYIQTSEAVLLISIYSKSDRANISNEEIEGIIDQYSLEIERQERQVMLDPTEEEPEIEDGSIDTVEEDSEVEDGSSIDTL